MSSPLSGPPGLPAVSNDTEQWFQPLSPLKYSPLRSPPGSRDPLGFVAPTYLPARSPVILEQPPPLVVDSVVEVPVQVPIPVPEPVQVPVPIHVPVMIEPYKPSRPPPQDWQPPPEPQAPPAPQNGGRRMVTSWFPRSEKPISQPHFSSPSKVSNPTKTGNNLSGSRGSYARSEARRHPDPKRPNRPNPNIHVVHFVEGLEEFRAQGGHEL